MIDCHAHLEQDDYNKDRQKVVDGLKKKMKAVITCCADPKDWERTKEIVEKNKGFVFATMGVHPEFIKDIPIEDIRAFFDVIRKEAKAGNIVGIGEQGLDYHWVKEFIFRDKQKELFMKFIDLSKELDLPAIIHSRDATLECVVILEERGMKGRKVLLHLFGDHKLVPRIIANGWYVSVGPGIQRSKGIRKLVRDLPLSQIVLETDSPWFGEEGERGTPLNTFKAAEKIAEIKKISIEEVEKQTDKNAIAFYGLKLKSK
ncbi:MAG: TatD family hydrolase [Nanoarchaeota archaeon]|nr:TatD family hydrolase [Nanoarchaeota archaeon]